MFTNGLLEEQKETIELHSVAPHILNSLVDFIYTGMIFLFMCVRAYVLLLIFMIYW